MLESKEAAAVYDNSARVAKNAYAENTTLKEAAVSLGLLSPDEFDAWVRPENMLRPVRKP